MGSEHTSIRRKCHGYCMKFESVEVEGAISNQSNSITITTAGFRLVSQLG